MKNLVNTWSEQQKSEFIAKNAKFSVGQVIKNGYFNGPTKYADAYISNIKIFNLLEDDTIRIAYDISRISKNGYRYRSLNKKIWSRYHQDFNACTLELVSDNIN